METTETEFIKLFFKNIKKSIKSIKIKRNLYNEKKCNCLIYKNNFKTCNFCEIIHLILINYSCNKNYKNGILFLHGFGGGSCLWGKFVNNFFMTNNDDIPIILIDLPNMGFSTSTLEDSTDKSLIYVLNFFNNIDKYFFICHSISGYLLEFAINNDINLNKKINLIFLLDPMKIEYKDIFLYYFLHTYYLTLFNLNFNLKKYLNFRYKKYLDNYGDLFLDYIIYCNFNRPVKISFNSNFKNTNISNDKKIVYIHRENYLLPKFEQIKSKIFINETHIDFIINDDVIKDVCLKINDFLHTNS